MPALKTPKPRPPLHDRLNSLLHTMRCIELQEPQLCSLLHEMKTTGKVTAKMEADLRGILDKLPAGAYTADLEAVEEALSH